MKRIPLTQGQFALVDDEDFEHLSQWKWRACFGKGLWYATRVAQDGQKHAMHHEILGIDPIFGTVQADHRNGNGLDNQKLNLRVSTQSENSRNRRKLRRVCASPYKGVGYMKSMKRIKRWRAILYLSRTNQVTLGCFLTDVEAAHAYDYAAREHFQEFAALNFPLSGERSALTGKICP